MLTFQEIYHDILNFYEAVYFNRMEDHPVSLEDFYIQHGPDPVWDMWGYLILHETVDNLTKWDNILDFLKKQKVTKFYNNPVNNSYKQLLHRILQNIQNQNYCLPLEKIKHFSSREGIIIPYLALNNAWKKFSLTHFNTYVKNFLYQMGRLDYIQSEDEFLIKNFIQEVFRLNYPNVPKSVTLYQLLINK